MTKELIGTWLWLVVVGLIVLGIFVQVAFFRRLRECHPRAYKDLGEPSLIVNMSMRNQARLMRFVWQRRDRDLADARLSTMVVFNQIATIACFLLILIAAVLGGEDY